MTTLPLNDRLSPTAGAAYVAAAAQTDFVADFPLIYNGAGAIEGLHVRSVRAGAETILDYPADFSVTAITDGGFTARLVAPAQAGDLVQVYSTLPASRDRAHAANGQIRTDTLEGDADSFQAQLQELRRDLDRTFVAPMGETPAAMPAAAARANMGVFTDADGNLVFLPNAPAVGVGVQAYIDLAANGAMSFGKRYWFVTAGGGVTGTVDPLGAVASGQALEFFTGDDAAINPLTVQMSGADQLTVDGQTGGAAQFNIPFATYVLRKLGGVARIQRIA